MTTRRRREDGSVSIWLATTGFAMVVLAGLAIDLGGHVHTQQRARAVAAEAARTGGQQLQAAPAIRGQAVRTDITAATRAAKTYLAASGMTGHVRVTGGDTITVDTADTYTTTFLGIIGITTLPVTGHAEAKVTRTVGGVEQ